MAERYTSSSSDEESLELQTKLFLWDFNQCDPKKCTGKKLVRLKLAREVAIGRKIPGLVLSPLAERTLSPEDRGVVTSRGLGVIDCSWKEVDKLPVSKLKAGEMRLLPFLGKHTGLSNRGGEYLLQCKLDLFANPVKYGQQCCLSCVEALAAALVILGLREDGEIILAKFKWGHSFLSLNGDLLDKYSKCDDAVSVLKVQNEYLLEGEREREKRGKRGYDELEDLMPPQDSSDEYDI